MTLQEEVNECLENCVDNSGLDEAMRDPDVIARELMEMTSLDNVPSRAYDDEDEYELYVSAINGYVQVWQELRR